MHVHEEVLETARQLAEGEEWRFTVREVVAALPGLNPSTVRTHVVSRCCVNAPKNHPHKWDYFRRVGRGVYQVEMKYRKASAVRRNSPRSRDKDSRNELRKNIHAVIQKDEGAYVVECLELPIVTQGQSLDEAVENFRQALALHLEGEDLKALGIAQHPDVQISYEMPAA